MIQLYDYQTKIIEKIRRKWQEGKKHVIVCSPTGSGKTVIFSWIAQQSFARGKRILILTHREELLKETGGTLEDFGIVPQLIRPGLYYPTSSHVSVAMTATLKNRLKTDVWKAWFRGLDLIIIDEAHQMDFDHIFEHATDKLVLGFTATPKRKGSQRQFADDYEDIVYGPDVQQLINLNYLVKDKYFGVNVDLSGIEKDSFGEYKNDQLFNRYNKAELYSGVVSNWLKIAQNTLTIVFCVNIQHCVNTAREFNRSGIRAKFITSDVQCPEMPEMNDDVELALYEQKMEEYRNWQDGYRNFSGTREAVLAEWKRKDFFVLINAGILTTGFNHKPIETVVINRATTSENLWLQMIGRGSRIFKGKEYFNILDFGQNADRLGHYRQQREYSLTHFTARKQEGIMSIKDCPQCGAMIFSSARICKYCAHLFPRTRKEIETELIEKKFEESAGKAIGELRTISEIETAATVQKYSVRWTWRMIYTKMGKDEFVSYMRGKKYEWKFIYKLIYQYNGKQSQKTPAKK